MALTAGPVRGIGGRVWLACASNLPSHTPAGCGAAKSPPTDAIAEEARRIIYHLVPADHWCTVSPTSPYLPRDFEKDGFIHCTRGLVKLLQVANTFYRDVPGEFLLLALDEGQILADVKYEDGFPHIYGPLNRNAIVAIYVMSRHEDGTFELPSGVDESSRR